MRHPRSSARPARRKQFAERPVGDQLALKIEHCWRRRDRRQPDRNRGLLDGFADRGDGRGLDPELPGELAIRLVDPATREDQRAGGERHALGALDHQQLRRAAGRSARDDQGRRGDRIVVAHARRLTCR